MLVFLGLLSSLAFVRVLLRPQGPALVGWWLLYVIATSAALYTHYDALVLLPVQFGLLLVLLAQRRVSGLGVGAALAAWPMIVVVYWPWLSSPAAQNFIGFAKLTGGYPGMLLERVLGVSLPSGDPGCCGTGRSGRGRYPWYMDFGPPPGPLACHLPVSRCTRGAGDRVCHAAVSFRLRTRVFGETAYGHLRAIHLPAGCLVLAYGWPHFQDAISFAIALSCCRPR